MHDKEPPRAGRIVGRVRHRSADVRLRDAPALWLPKSARPRAFVMRIACKPRTDVDPKRRVNELVISNGREEVLHKRQIKLAGGQTQTDNVVVSENRAVN